MSRVAAAVWVESSLISLATTANPLPASPARAASMVAFKERSLVWSEISLMVSVTLPMAWAALPSSDIRLKAFLDLSTASLETLLAISAFRAISLMVEFISSAAEAIILVLVEDCSMAAATLLILVLISSAAPATLLALAAVVSALDKS